MRAGRRLLRAVSLAGCAAIGDEAATVLAGERAAACRPVFHRWFIDRNQRRFLVTTTVSMEASLTLGATATHARDAGLPHLEVVSLSRTAVTDAMVDALTFGVRRRSHLTNAPADPELEGWIPLERLAEIELRGARGRLVRAPVAPAVYMRDVNEMSTTAHAACGVAKKHSPPSNVCVYRRDGGDGGVHHPFVGATSSGPVGFGSHAGERAYPTTLPPRERPQPLRAKSLGR
jgi:hypothetical protein